LEIQILRFLGNTAAVGRHEGVLKFITDRKNVTRAEIEAYYRNGIGKLVSDIVDEKAAENQPINPTYITELKQILTNFFLNPTRENFDVLCQKGNRYASTDGQRGINTRITMAEVVSTFNSDLSAVIANPSRLTLK